MRILFIIIQLTLILSACAVQQGRQEQNIEKESTRQQETKPIHVKDTSQETKDNGTRTDIAKHLVGVAEKVPDVKDATAVVLGGYAVVGIDVDDNLDRSKVETIKYSVAQALKNDRHGANAVVVADPDTVSRLNEMGREISEGRPVTGILDELAAIVGRVLPEVPNDVIDDEDEPQTKQQNDQLNEKQEKEMETEQNDQSDHHMKKNNND
ncbi:YhcN/YlaJ family sporulation lipoprotein [Bacillus mojavensis]|uniref:Phosphonate ABC transporter phosphate-binding periplasmic protein n=1 Tax=Bacillus mojavensis TaxID=72360 RepID=A0AAP3CRT9_BACMO|nr:MULTISPECIES: YhcN/YlaJ family sporulation lipoprotein [Bacillus]MCC2929721.1 YhcN/YlaJ family sporulation lipoprotein [Bacillus sp. LBG-1-113]MCY8103739.1 YhcN/YlaJ family sporulation lipoprotein [Bacillus mojavensis]MCY8481093.1 YhcN/YlaJ family sporulation lipoprotein [Bacillus mojavensis]MCY8510021.1 YhcN/YlaJ family sporulation lipoprotein [Bacillus mojavensis]MCY9092384.1 YhcN/YlaJ family sporulation lipoprotein [Bacillus mojavensis]